MKAVFVIICIASAYFYGEYIGYELGFSKGKLDVCDVVVRDDLYKKTWCVVNE